MNSSRFNINVIVFSISIALTAFLFTWAIGQENKIVTSISLAIAWILEIILLIRYVNITNRNLLLFLQSFQFKDSSLVFNKNKRLPFKPIYNEFNRISDQFNHLKITKEIEHQYFEYIIKHVDTGLIAWDKQDRVQLFNQAAKKLLNLPHISNIKGLRSVTPDMPEILRKLKPGRQELLKILKGDELIRVYVRVSEFTISGEKITLASFQNIHPELEESESEAWQKLIKVLTHEIVNSVGPIKLVSSALLKTMGGLVEHPSLTLSAEEVENMQSGLNAIHNRSLGLSKFVDDYKSMTDLPRPDFKNVKILELINGIIALLKDNILNEEIKIRITVKPDDLRVLMDRKMIEQVMINLIKNAVHSLEDQSKPIININSQKHNDRIYITVDDNGCGIPFNMLDYVFMPFFTTKKGGSGIGLTLSRQIMKVHNGLIHIVSKEGEGTRVVLIF
jgi:nitrogen fixation/metabolism regulation signal transduction histidine kinase